MHRYIVFFIPLSKHFPIDTLLGRRAFLTALRFLLVQRWALLRTSCLSLHCLSMTESEVSVRCQLHLGNPVALAFNEHSQKPE